MKSERDDYQNYKGWQSIQVLALTTSFYTFAQAEVGYPGGTGDATIHEFCDFTARIREDPVACLGPGGLVLCDGGFGGDAHSLTPYRDPQYDHQKYFNFCHSSQRISIEQTFGMWKNRFRLVMLGLDQCVTSPTCQVGFYFLTRRRLRRAAKSTLKHCYTQQLDSLG